MRGSGVRFPLPAYQSMTYERTIFNKSAFSCTHCTQMRTQYTKRIAEYTAVTYPNVYPAAIREAFELAKQTPPDVTPAEFRGRGKTVQPCLPRGAGAAVL